MVRGDTLSTLSARLGVGARALAADNGLADTTVLGAGLSKVEFTAMDATASGTVDRAGDAIRFTDIVLRLRLTVPAGTDPDRVQHVIEKSKKACLISASLSVPVRLESQIARA